jgi:hypothetical protein
MHAMVKLMSIKPRGAPKGPSETSVIVFVYPGSRNCRPFGRNTAEKLAVIFIDLLLQLYYSSGNNSNMCARVVVRAWILPSDGDMVKHASHTVFFLVPAHTTVYHIT